MRDESEGITMMEMSSILHMEQSQVQVIKAQDSHFPPVIQRTTKGLIYDRAAFKAWYAKRKIGLAVDVFLAFAFLTSKPVVYGRSVKRKVDDVN